MFFFVLIFLAVAVGHLGGFAGVSDENACVHRGWAGDNFRPRFQSIFSYYSLK